MRALAEFYRDLLGMQLYEPYGDLTLQRRPPEYPQHLHFDIAVPDTDYRFPDGAQPATRRAVDLGAIYLPPNESTAQWYADPSGRL